MGRLFVSYRHHQREWIWQRLVPALEAGGVDILIDRDEFRAGEGVIGQMDEQQDRADATLAVLTPQYLDSPYCMHELERGLARHKVIPVVRADCAIPEMIEKPDPLLRVDLREPEDPYVWGDLLDSCGAPQYLLASTAVRQRDRPLDRPTDRAGILTINRVVQFLERGQSVNLVSRGTHLWKPLLRRVRQRIDSLGEVDLEDPRATTRQNLVQLILAEFGYSGKVPRQPEDLVEFGRVLNAKTERCRLALLRFDYAPLRRGYGLDFFSSLRNLVMDSRKLVLLVQSHEHFANLMPHDHPMSAIDIKTVELLGPQR